MKKLFFGVSKALETINLLSCVAMVIMMLTIMTDVVLRVFNHYVPGQIEICFHGNGLRRVVRRGQVRHPR
jgi:hypothetical protein